MKGGGKTYGLDDQMSNGEVCLKAETCDDARRAAVARLSKAERMSSFASKGKFARQREER